MNVSRVYWIRGMYLTYTTRMAQGPKKTPAKTAPDQYKVEVARRIYDAFTAAAAKRPRGSELTQSEVGALVAKELRRKVPFPQATVSRWMSERDPALPDPLTLRAIAKVLGTSATWLHYGAAMD